MGARYSRQSGYTIAKRSPARPTVRGAKPGLTFGPTAAKVFGFAILAILGVVMLSQAGGGTTTAYQQNNLRQQISQTDQQTQALQLEAERAQSIQQISTSPAKNQMQPVQSVGNVETGDVAGVSTSRP
jgi:uncharacterized protein HemX